MTIPARGLCRCKIFVHKCISQLHCSFCCSCSINCVRSISGGGRQVHRHNSNHHCQSQNKRQKPAENFTAFTFHSHCFVVKYHCLLVIFTLTSRDISSQRAERAYRRKLFDERPGNSACPHCSPFCKVQFRRSCIYKQICRINHPHLQIFYISRTAYPFDIYLSYFRRINFQTPRLPQFRLRQYDSKLREKNQ